MTTKDELLRKIERRQATVCVVGLGYVGLPLAVAFAREGFPTIGLDVDVARVEAVNRGDSYVEDIPSTLLAEVVSSSGHLHATTDYSALDRADAVLICVPTPLSKTKDPDVSYILAAGQAIGRRLHAGMLVVLESTTYPGTTEDLLLPLLLEEHARHHPDGAPLVVGRDVFLAFSPERIDPGRTDYTLRNTPKVIGGMTPACLEVAQALYTAVVEHCVPVSSPRTAEMVKLLENLFRTVNIALINEVAIMCDCLGIDVWEVIEAAKTKPFGYMPFYPGPGLGGHCLPVDPQYLAWKMRTLNYNARFVQLAAEINFQMPRYVATKVADALNEEGKPVKGSRILLLGVAYKPDVGDTRESPALEIAQIFVEKGARLHYHDPYVPTIELNGQSFHSVELTETTLADADCTVIVTDHTWYDWTWVARHARLIVDTRNACRHVREPRGRIVKL
ncbi:MAG: nucleotide sugar dehydrogenase [Ardenticatenia bacterium]|nr:nucleotide sugar dehydrogenase [Ardenticatenia bacterium]